MEGQLLTDIGPIFEWTTGNPIVDHDEDIYQLNYAMENINYDSDYGDSNYENSNDTNGGDDEFPYLSSD